MLTDAVLLDCFAKQLKGLATEDSDGMAYLRA